MSSENSRTPVRLLMLGCTSFAGFDSVAWEDQVVPNIPDYDLVIVSVPHITEEFLKSVKGDFLQDLRHALVRFLHSGGKMVALVSANFTVQRPSKYPEPISSNHWCPIAYTTREEAGKSIVRKQEMYSSYLNKMSEWSFYLSIPQAFLTRELIDFYGPTHKTMYNLKLEPYLENRYGRVLAGQFHVEVRRERKRSNQWGPTSSEYPKVPDDMTGTIVLLPLIDRISPEEALAEILQEEVGFSLASPEPDWALKIEMPLVPELVRQLETAQAIIVHEGKTVEQLKAQISAICSFRRLLYGTGSELETIVKRSLEQLGATVSPSKYSQEEYILEFDGQEFIMEVKGVAKSISLGHLRQLIDYLLKYQENTGKDYKGILFGNAWRNTPPEMRGTEDTPEFPDNVVKRAEQLGISLVSAKAFFDAFVRALKAPEVSNDLLAAITRSSGIAFPLGKRGLTSESNTTS